MWQGSISPGRPNKLDKSAALEDVQQELIIGLVAYRCDCSKSSGMQLSTRTVSLQARIDRLAFQGQDAEDARDCDTEQR